MLKRELFNGEREIPGRQKVVRGSSGPVLTSHVGLNPRSKRASLSHQASLAALRAGYIYSGNDSGKAGELSRARVITGSLVIITK